MEKIGRFAESEKQDHSLRPVWRISFENPCGHVGALGGSPGRPLMASSTRVARFLPLFFFFLSSSFLLCPL